MLNLDTTQYYEDSINLCPKCVLTLRREHSPSKTLTRKLPMEHLYEETFALFSKKPYVE